MQQDQTAASVGSASIALSTCLSRLHVYPAKSAAVVYLSMYFFIDWKHRIKVLKIVAL